MQHAPEHGWYRPTKRFDFDGRRWSTTGTFAVVHDCDDALPDLGHAGPSAIGFALSSEVGPEVVTFERVPLGYCIHDAASERAYQTRFVVLVEAVHPGCEWRGGRNPLSPCAAFVDGKAVAVVMPVRADFAPRAYTKPAPVPRCFVCDGDRGVPCHDCGGDGKKTCATCHGDGRARCPACDHNTGKCDKCGGTGHDGPCSACNGSGLSRKCEACDGTGDWRPS